MTAYNPGAWAAFKQTLAAIEPPPDPTAPIGNCPSCGAALISFYSWRAKDYKCVHPASQYCPHRFLRIAAEPDLLRMRELAREWIEENRG